MKEMTMDRYHSMGTHRISTCIPLEILEESSALTGLGVHL
jgi:hypothetical protein